MKREPFSGRMVAEYFDNGTDMELRAQHQAYRRIYDVPSEHATWVKIDAEYQHIMAKRRAVAS